MVISLQPIPGQSTSASCGARAAPSPSSGAAGDKLREFSDPGGPAAGDMAFLLTTLAFFVVGLLGSLAAKLTGGGRASTTLLHITLVDLAVICCWMLWAIVYVAQMHPLILPQLKGEGE